MKKSDSTGSGIKNFFSKKKNILLYFIIVLLVTVSTAWIANLAFKSTPGNQKEITGILHSLTSTFNSDKKNYDQLSWRFSNKFIDYRKSAAIRRSKTLHVKLYKQVNTNFAILKTNNETGHQDLLTATRLIYIMMILHALAFIFYYLRLRKKNAKPNVIIVLPATAFIIGISAIGMYFSSSIRENKNIISNLKTNIELDDQTYTEMLNNYQYILEDWRGIVKTYVEQHYAYKKEIFAQLDKLDGAVTYKFMIILKMIFAAISLQGFLLYLYLKIITDRKEIESENLIEQVEALSTKLKEDYTALSGSIQQEMQSSLQNEFNLLAENLTTKIGKEFDMLFYGNEESVGFKGTITAIKNQIVEDLKKDVENLPEAVKENFINGVTEIPESINNYLRQNLDEPLKNKIESFSESTRSLYQEIDGILAGISEKTESLNSEIDGIKACLKEDFNESIAKDIDVVSRKTKKLKSGTEEITGAIDTHKASAKKKSSRKKTAQKKNTKKKTSPKEKPVK
ncbi:MAG: hypothetical protein GY754_23805 [bacterium]|nr:hypothetical protein [bacterium]